MARFTTAYCIAFFFGRRPLPFDGSHLRLPSGPAGSRPTTGSLSALARPTPSLHSAFQESESPSDKLVGSTSCHVQVRLLALPMKSFIRGTGCAPDCTATKDEDGAPWNELLGGTILPFAPGPLEAVWHKRTSWSFPPLPSRSEVAELPLTSQATGARELHSDQLEEIQDNHRVPVHWPA